MRRLSAATFLATSACWTGLSSNGDVRVAPVDTDVSTDTELEMDTEPEPDTEWDTELEGGPDADTDADTDADSEQTLPAQACYLGADGLGNLCLPLVVPAVLPGDYSYPVPFQGSPQFREPRAFIDVDATDLDVMISPDFPLRAFATTGGELLVVQPASIARLQAIRDSVGTLVVERGYRSPAENSADGGGVYDRYMYGDGFRLRPTEVTPAELADACRVNGAGFVEELGLIVHCDWRNIPFHIGFYDYP